ncbi:TPA: hypothetical protein ACGCIQ_002393 [Legionella pneumophila]|uniref:hypothetical protein n=1 Tax=Legionella pneumophila TaxID=446 RepID=UPI001CEF9E0A|nr:hypothetical protein [Legionella pneumophila]
MSFEKSAQAIVDFRQVYNILWLKIIDKNVKPDVIWNLGCIRFAENIRHVYFYKRFVIDGFIITHDLWNGKELCIRQNQQIIAFTIVFAADHGCDFSLVMLPNRATNYCFRIKLSQFDWEIII